MIKEAINALVSGQSLTFELASRVMEEIMSGEATPAQTGAFLTALRVKGEIPEEIAGMASVMRAKATPVKINYPAIDIVGTGGDGSGSFNISTAACFAAAGAGLKVAKHGNRAATSKCGAADVLEALGVKIILSPESVAECVDKAGVGFMFAQTYHPAMKFAGPVRKEIGIRTVFNILGPLTNPAHVQHMLLGVASEELGNKISSVLYKLGIEHALVVYGTDGLDEISISATSRVWDVTSTKISPSYEITPESFGLKQADKSEILGGAPAENAAVMRSILDGAKSALRDAVVMNAAAALIAGNLATDFQKAARMAEESIDSGRAKEALNKLVEISQRLG
jgi:anthranilate phosphoribosyltransferase